MLLVLDVQRAENVYNDEEWQDKEDMITRNVNDPLAAPRSNLSYEES